MNKPLTHFILSSLLLLPAVPQAETVTKRVDLDRIKHIHLAGPYDLAIHQGSGNYVILTADSEVLEKIEAKVQGGKLVLGEVRKGWRLFDDDEENIKASFEVQVEELRSVMNLGIGTVVIKNINTGEDLAFSNMGTGRYVIESIRAADVEFSNFGSGRIEVKDLSAEEISEHSFGAGSLEYLNIVAKDWEIKSLGSSATTIGGDSSAEEIEIDIQGSGEVDARGLRVNKADVAVSGAGVARVNVVEELEVKISGSGTVFYLGTPEIDKSISGSGELIPSNN